MRDLAKGKPVLVTEAEVRDHLSAGGRIVLSGHAHLTAKYGARGVLVITCSRCDKSIGKRNDGPAENRRVDLFCELHAHHAQAEVTSP